ncbi:hypothetical protein C3436_09490 [Citrobacter amalonaticus]|nr:hypothetical protein C3436_09490 [Citrobacter amalonaticus]
MASETSSSFRQPVYHQHNLEKIIGGTPVTLQDNLNSLNKKLAVFVMEYLNGDNPEPAKKVIESLLGEFIKDERYVKITAQDAFAALSFFISDIKNWNGVNSGIMIPRWASDFFSDSKNVVWDGIHDITSQREGNHHSQKFARITKHMYSSSYDKTLSETTTKAQQELMLKAGERYLLESIREAEYDNSAKVLVNYHDTVTSRFREEICSLIIAEAAEKFSTSLSREQALATFKDDLSYGKFKLRAKELKRDLFACEILNSDLPKGTLRIKRLLHPTTSHAYRGTFTPEFIRAAGRLLLNAYTFPIPDSFIDKIFVKGECDVM